MESVRMEMLCDADYCACNPQAQALRGSTTIADCEEIYRRANEKGDVSDARNETDEQAV